MNQVVTINVQELEALRRAAARFDALQNMPHVQAQAFFWNFRSRRERAKAIDAALRCRKY